MSPEATWGLVGVGMLAVGLLVWAVVAAPLKESRKARARRLHPAGKGTTRVWVEDFRRETPAGTVTVKGHWKDVPHPNE